MSPFPGDFLQKLLHQNLCHHFHAHLRVTSKAGYNPAAVKFSVLYVRATVKGLQVNATGIGAI